MQQHANTYIRENKILAKISEFTVNAKKNRNGSKGLITKQGTNKQCSQPMGAFARNKSTISLF